MNFDLAGGQPSQGTLVWWAAGHTKGRWQSFRREEGPARGVRYLHSTIWVKCLPIFLQGSFYGCVMCESLLFHICASCLHAVRRVALCMEDFRPVPSGSCCKLKFQHMTSITCLILHLTGRGFWEETSVLGRYSWIEHNFWHMSKKCNFKMTAPPAWPEVAWQCFEARTGFLTHGTCANFWQLTHKLWHLFCALPLPGGKYVNTIISKMLSNRATETIIELYSSSLCLFVFIQHSFSPVVFQQLKKIC